MKAISEDNIIRIKESLITLEIKAGDNSTELWIRDDISEGLKAVKELFENSIEDERINADDVKFLLELLNNARETATYPINRTKALDIRNLLDGVITRLKGSLLDVMDVPVTP